MIQKRHQFFLLSHRPWPLISSINALVVFSSIILLLKFQELFSLFISLLFFFSSSILWWNYYRSEFNLEGLESFNLNQGLKYSILLFISSEIFFFFSFFWAYFHFSLCPVTEIGIAWPPYGVSIFDCLAVPLINTIILLSSGAAVTLRHHKLIKGAIKCSKKYLIITIFLGLVFSLLQYQEYVGAIFTIRDSTFGCSFFMLTGFHGIHVIIGTVFLLTSFLWLDKIVIRKGECLRFELRSWYWHFVDVVWIFLYFILYYVNNT